METDWLDIERGINSEQFPFPSAYADGIKALPEQLLGLEINNLQQ